MFCGVRWWRSWSGSGCGAIYSSWWTLCEQKGVKRCRPHVGPGLVSTSISSQDNWNQMGDEASWRCPGLVHQAIDVGDEQKKSILFFLPTSGMIFVVISHGHPADTERHQCGKSKLKICPTFLFHFVHFDWGVGKILVQSQSNALSFLADWTFYEHMLCFVHYTSSKRRYLVNLFLYLQRFSLRFC